MFQCLKQLENGKQQPEEKKISYFWNLIGKSCKLYIKNKCAFDSFYLLKT